MEGTNNMNIEAIIDKMTLEEKIAICEGKTTWLTNSLERLEIPSILMANGSYGLAVTEADKGNDSDDNDLPFSRDFIPSVSFPCSAAIASTWNKELVYQIGKALGEECNNQGVHILLGPGINIKRSPLCGRNFEYYSEDPCLAGELGAAYIDGVKSENVAVSLKHFAGNNTEYRRFTIDTILDERTLREIYLAAFERIVKKSNPDTIMGAYNKINGHYACENKHLLTEILRDEWGFEGVVVSDWGAIENRVKSLEAGCDLEMPGPKPNSEKEIAEAVNSNKINVELINTSVKRILTLVNKCIEKDHFNIPDMKKHHELAIKAEEEAIVLLKNQDQLLPLDIEKMTSLAVIGEAAVNSNFLKGVSAFMTPSQLDEPLYVLEEKLGQKIKINYAQGYDKEDKKDKEKIEQAVEMARKSNCALIIVRVGQNDYMEGVERKSLVLPEQQVNLIQEVAKVQPNIIVGVMSGSAFEVTQWEKNVKSILSLSHGGQGIGTALYNILVGNTNPSGKLAESFPIKLSDTPSYINMPTDSNYVCYGENIFVGYRYYDKKQMEVQYPFGYGLSYTDFKYSSLYVEEESPKSGLVNVKFTIKNIGNYDGAEVVQLYIRDKESFLPRPEKELKAFEKVFLKAGEEKEIKFVLDKRDFSYYYPEKSKWIAEEGEFEILIGSSSRDIRLSDTIIPTFGEKIRNSLGLTRESFLSEWLSDDKGKKTLQKVFGRELFDFLFNPNASFHGAVLNFPLKRLPNNNFLTKEQIDDIINVYNNL